MSGMPERIVALAADQLPEPERSRRSEEWSADLAGASDQGVSRLGVAMGALTFALRAPIASPVAADRWARWALTFAAIGPVVWLSLRTSGLFMSNPPLRDAIEPLMTVAAVIAFGLVVVTGLRTRGMPWAASGTVILLCLSALLWVVGTPNSSRFALFVIASLALAFVGLVVVAVRLRGAPGTARAHVLALIALAALPVLVLVYPLAGQVAPWVPLVVAVVAAILASVANGRSAHTQMRASIGLRRASVLVVVVAVIGVGTALAGLVSTIMQPHPTFSPKAWAIVVSGASAQAIAASVVAIVLIAAYLLLAAAARRRHPSPVVPAVGVLIAASLAGVASTFPFNARWDINVSVAISTGMAFASCVLAVVGVILLIAPLEARSTVAAASQPA